jgi:hypothetical protein
VINDNQPANFPDITVEVLHLRDAGHSGGVTGRRAAQDAEPSAAADPIRGSVAELRRAGLNASWGGTTAHPIVVEGIVWRRRRQ